MQVIAYLQDITSRRLEGFNPGRVQAMVIAVVGKEPLASPSIIQKVWDRNACHKPSDADRSKPQLLSAGKLGESSSTNAGRVTEKAGAKTLDWIAYRFSAAGKLLRVMLAMLRRRKSP